MEGNRNILYFYEKIRYDQLNKKQEVRKKNGKGLRNTGSE